MKYFIVDASLTYYLQQCGCLGKEAECAFIQGEAMGRPSVIADFFVVLQP